jgi:hypothetical protein
MASRRGKGIALTKSPVHKRYRFLYCILVFPRRWLLLFCAWGAACMRRVNVGSLQAPHEQVCLNFPIRGRTLSATFWKGADGTFRTGLHCREKPGRLPFSSTWSAKLRKASALKNSPASIELYWEICQCRPAMRCRDLVRKSVWLG